MTTKQKRTRPGLLRDYRATAGYTPRRAGTRWREGAPEYVLDCFDNGGETVDRYTVLLCGSLWQPEFRHTYAYLAMSDAPGHPQGFSQYGEGATPEFRYRQ